MMLSEHVGYSVRTMWQEAPCTETRREGRHAGVKEGK